MPGAPDASRRPAPPRKGEAAAQTVSSLYDAVLSPERWPEALDNVRTLFGGGASVVYLEDRRTGDVPVWFSVGTEGGEDEYIEHVKNINPRVKFAEALPAGVLMSDLHFLPERAMDRHPFYDWLRKTHGFRYFLGCRMFEQGAHRAFASVEWSGRQGPPGKEQAELFRYLLPHIQQALTLTLACEELRAQASALEAAVAPMANGVMLLDRLGRPAFVNEAARVMLARGDGVMLDDGRLSACKAADARSVGRLVANVLRAIDAGNPPPGGTRVVARRGGGAPYVVSVAPAPPRSSLAISGATVLIVIRDLSARRPDTALLIGALGLTRREAEVVCALHVSDDLRRTADDLGIAFDTARAHLRNIFRKTGARSQAELARLVAQLLI